MDTVLMAIAVIRRGDKVLIRKFDPTKNLYQEPWGIFGGKLEGNGSSTDMLNRELKSRWGITVVIKERLAWDEEVKVDHDGRKKHFIYLGVLCEIASGEPLPVNQNEELRLVRLGKELRAYTFNPPTVRVFKRLSYL